MSADMSKPSQPAAPLTLARMTAYGLAIFAGLLTSAIATKWFSYQGAQLIILVQIVIILLCFLLCRRAPLGGPERFSPTFIALIAFVLSWLVVPA